MEAVIKSPRATIDFSPVSITRATHSHDSGQTRVRISGSRRAGCRRMVEFVLRASTNIDCGKEKRRERERGNGICRTASPIHRGECRRSTSANLNDFTRYRCQAERRRARNKPGNFSLSDPRLSSKNETNFREPLRICFDHFPRFSGNLRVCRVYSS